MFGLIGAVLTILIAGGAGVLASVMQCPAEAFPRAVSYIRICGLGILVIIAYNLIGSIFRGIGDSVTPLITVAIACVCNIAGDLALVELYTFGMEELTAESPLAFFPLAIRDDWGQVMLSASTAEALWTLLCVPAACLIRKKGGSAFAFCAYTLCACPFFIDTVKIVSIIFYYVHVEQALCALVMLALLARQARTCGGRAATVLIPAALCVAVNGLTQYLLDKPSTFAWMMSEEAFVWLNDHLAPFCYTVMLCTALGLLALGHFQYRKKTDREME